MSSLEHRWLAPPIDQPLEFPTRERIEEIEKEAYAEGFRQGMEAGRSAGTEQIAATVAALEGMLAQLTDPLERIDEQISESLLLLATRLAGALCRIELDADERRILDVLAEARAVLPFGEQALEVRLHAADIAIVEDAYQIADATLSAPLVADSALERGEVIINGAHARVDATLATRLDQVFATLRDGAPAHRDEAR